MMNHWRRTNRKRKFAACLALYLLIEMEEEEDRARVEASKRRGSKPGRKWMGALTASHDEEGTMMTIIPKLDIGSTGIGSFSNFHRLDKDLFELLLRRVGPFIQRADTMLRAAIPAREILSFTLYFLATGCSFTDMHNHWCIGMSTISEKVEETCRVIFEVLKEDYMKCPTTPEEWRKVSRDYADIWGFPNCLGALGGKHVMMGKPVKVRGKYRYNAKSRTVIALVDANLRFLYTHVGTNDHPSDGEAWKDTILYQRLEEGTIGVPEPEPLPGSEQTCQQCILADAAFPPSRHLVKPYPGRSVVDSSQKKYNDRLSRAWSCAERSLGMLATVWRVFKSPLLIQPQKADLAILACCALQNLILTEKGGPFYCRIVEEQQAYNEGEGAFHHLRLPRPQSEPHPPEETPADVRHQLCAHFNRTN